MPLRTTQGWGNQHNGVNNNNRFSGGQQPGIPGSKSNVKNPSFSLDSKNIQANRELTAATINGIKDIAVGAGTFQDFRHDMAAFFDETNVERRKEESIQSAVQKLTNRYNVSKDDKKEINSSVNMKILAMQGYGIAKNVTEGLVSLAAYKSRNITKQAKIKQGMSAFNQISGVAVSFAVNPILGGIAAGGMIFDEVIRSQEINFNIAQGAREAQIKSQLMGNIIQNGNR